MAEAPKSVRFNSGLDVTLLQKIKLISSNIKSINWNTVVEELKKEISSGTVTEVQCKGRFRKLVDEYKKKDWDSLKSSCTDKVFEQKMKLLSDLLGGPEGDNDSTKQVKTENKGNHVRDEVDQRKELEDNDLKEAERPKVKTSKKDEIREHLEKRKKEEVKIKTMENKLQKARMNMDLQETEFLTSLMKTL